MTNTTRRGALQLGGGGVVGAMANLFTGPSSSAAENTMYGGPVCGLNVAPVPRSLEECYEWRRLKELFNPEQERERRRSAWVAAREHGVDADLEDMKSVSKVAKMRMQAERNYQFQLENEKSYLEREVARWREQWGI